MKPRRSGMRSTPAGEHRPVMLHEVLAGLNPQPGEIVVDCTVGWAGHAEELLQRVGPAGQLVGFDLDADNLPKARERLQALNLPFTLHHGNFAGIAAVLGELAMSGVDVLVADLGMSSMQLDDAERGFSYVRDGPLDMRMDRTRGKSAAQVLATIGERELAAALHDLGDEPAADQIAAAVVVARGNMPLERTGQLARVVQDATAQPGEWRLHPAPHKWTLHPAARTFQALRILVNRELGNLEALLRVLPGLLRPGGRAGIISFHSGEDRLVKAAFRDGQRAGLYEEVSAEASRASYSERLANPRSRSAKLRLARRNGPFSPTRA